MYKRPIEHAEEMLIKGIMDGTFPAGSKIPNERDLSAQLGVTRPTLREALRRLESDGWLVVQQGKSTCVNDVWRYGGLNVLSSMMRYSDTIYLTLVEPLLRVRLELAPAYTRDAVMNNPAGVITLLENIPDPDTDPALIARFDWELQHGLTVASGNPIYPLLLNGFAGIYLPIAETYFQPDTARHSSYRFYQALLRSAQDKNSAEAESITREIMQLSITHWLQLRENTLRENMLELNRN